MRKALNIMVPSGSVNVDDEKVVTKELEEHFTWPALSDIVCLFPD